VRRAVWLVLAAAGCNQVLGVTDPHLRDGGAGDDATDGSAACAGDGFGYKISNVASCDIPAATGGLVLANATIDTTAGTITVDAAEPLADSTVVAQAGGGPQVRVVSVTDFRIPPGITVRVVGQYGLVVVVRGSAAIDGQLLASADHTTPAAGSRSAALCSGSAGTPGTLSAGSPSSSGGGGGGHGGDGALGGAAMSFIGGAILPGGPGGIADTNLPLQPLRGGCPGGGDARGAPASGGGAIQISASGRIDLSGTIAAAGGGAVAGDTTVSASAGGSGGGILLEAGTIAMTAGAAVTANGGAGADGSGTAAACSGENGHPGDAIPAAGGSCSADVSGGAGGAGGTPAHGGDSGLRGTGGGGAVGRIAIHSHAFTRGVVSPPPNLDTF